MTSHFKNGMRVKPLQVRTWGYVCGMPDPYHLGADVYAVEGDSAPYNPDEPEKYHWEFRLKELPGVKFLEDDFQEVK